MRNPLLPAASAFALGILAARLMGFDARELLAGIAGTLALAAWARRAHSRRAAATALCTAMLLAGALTAVLQTPGLPPEIDAAAHETVILEGCVVEPPTLIEDRVQFILELDRQARARVSATLRDGESAPPLRYGQKVEVAARVRKPRNFRNPGAFDYAGWLARRGIYWTATSRSAADIKLLAGECGSAFWRAIYAARLAGLAALDRLYPADGYTSAMMQAMLLGEPARLEKVWTEYFRRTGTYHALVISGLHVSILAAVLLFLLRILWVPREWATSATALLAWLYACVSGCGQPVLRAAAGFSLFAAASLFYRRGRILNLLALVAIAFLAADSSQLFDASFQLSFVAVAAIGALASPFLERTSASLAAGTRRLADDGIDLRFEPRVAQFRVELRLAAEALRLWTRMPARLACAGLGIMARATCFCFELAAVSAAVQLGLALPMIYYFHRVPLTALTANLLAVPLLSAAVPVGFLAMFTGWDWVARAAALMLAAARWIVDVHAGWEPAWRVPDPPLWLALALAASLLALAFLSQWRCAALPAVCASLFLICIHPFAPDVTRGSFELTAMDVGQGDGLLLAFPDGKTAVVDAGGIPAFGRRVRSRLDIGEDVISPYLWTRSLQRLDVLVLTHAHEDHSGGLAALIENFRPRELWTGVQSDSPAWQAAREQARRFGVRIVLLRAGAGFSFGGGQVQVLAPFADYQPSASPRNNDSLVLSIRYGRHTFLLTGDMEREVEHRLGRENLPGRVDVLKVAHHGSKTSSTGEFLTAARPAFAIISVGQDNPYRHPSTAVLDRLRESGARILRTDTQGMVTVRSDGRRLHVETYSSSGRGGRQSVFAPPVN